MKREGPSSSDPIFRTFLIGDIRGYTSFTSARRVPAAGRLERGVDVASRSVVGALPGPTGLFNTVAFTPDGSYVLVIYENGRGLRWTFDPHAWANRACDVAGRTLTRPEWNRFLPDLPYDPACSSAAP